MMHTRDTSIQYISDIHSWNNLSFINFFIAVIKVDTRHFEGSFFPQRFVIQKVHDFKHTLPMCEFVTLKMQC